MIFATDAFERSIQIEANDPKKLIKDNYQQNRVRLKHIRSLRTMAGSLEIVSGGIGET